MGPAVDLQTPISELRAALALRRIQEGFQILESLRPALAILEATPGAGVLVGMTAQWVDAGFDNPGLLERLLERFPRSSRQALPLIDYLHLRMAESVLSMFHEEFDAAAASLEGVLTFAEEVDDPEMFAIANFWAGRCFRKGGHYDRALEHTGRAERLALDSGYSGMAAISQVTLSWLAFQKGRLREATAILDRAEEALGRTDDFLNRGNIQSAYGRIARRQGRFEAAISRFERAICEYQQAGGARLYLARTLVNLAFVKRTVAARLQREADESGGARKEHRARIEHIRTEAREALDEAGAIYGAHQNHRGMATVRITAGFLHVDAGDLEHAATDGAEAFAEGARKSDLIVMARARTLQCIVENAMIEEELGDAAHHREAAEAFAREAVEIAGRTENRRVLARALVWQGLTLTTEPADLESARRSCERATALVQPEETERQYVWDDMETLRRRVLYAQPVDGVLRAWCAGQVEGRSFQQITEEFARIVIPRVWEREGRKVSKVAQKLSISPKKVRRILHSAGVKERLNG